MDLPANDSSANKPSRKKKPSPSSQTPEIFQSPTHEALITPSGRKGQKASKRGAVNEGLQPDSMADPGNEYRALRRKYLLLEEESFGLGRELKGVEDDIKTLEDEKMSLLDELVVLEGLVDPAMDNIQSRERP